MRLLQFIGRVLFGLVAFFAIAVFAAFLWGVATTWFDRRMRSRIEDARWRDRR